MHSSKNIENAEKTSTDYVALARNAASGDRAARREINDLAHPMISYQTERFCKRFCAENKFLYRCSLEMPWGNAPRDALLCEWGNASYAWMLNDLTHENRLQQYEGRNGARLQDYIFCIANSLPFYERWKDWRFGRRIRVPDYVKDIDADAARVFLAMRGGDNIELVAQKCGLNLQATEVIAQKIIIVLTKKHRLHLLSPDYEQPLSEPQSRDEVASSEPAPDQDIAVYDPDPALQQRAQQLHDAWQQLTAVEQFVMEAMVIDEQDANDVLAALKKLNIQINDRMSAQDTDRQQLYYFRRKTLARLAELMGEE
jgi:hypothetical protein